MVTELFDKARRAKRPIDHLQRYRAKPLSITATPSKYFLWKADLDFCLSLLLLVPGLLLMGIACILVRLTSRGPAIFCQRRVGRNGEIFNLYKIRSMTANAEERLGPTWVQSCDPRVTPVGHFLRKFHLDELPQLFNVLKGEMSLVGPRPERPEFVEVLSKQLPAYDNRLAVRPGITGLAQLNLPPDCNIDSVRSKVILDIEYIQTAGLWMDLRLIACTALRFVKLPILGFFGLSRSVKLPPQTLEITPPDTEMTVVTLMQIQQKLRSRFFNGGSSGNGEQVRSNRNDTNRSSKP